ncbi:MAG TPA: radical SAM protein [Syntrophales bacterium]|nr:radical SAM protein [Syntrophales bacterium]HQB29220.1 radical SAM protein [Syntrophales bacterium]
MMEKRIKMLLLRHGGYETARRLHQSFQDRKLRKRVRSFQETGFLALPGAVMFEPTQRCNLRCRMCYQDRAALTGGDELDSGEIGWFFKENPRLRKVTLYGGEIFMRKDLLDIIRSLGPYRTVILPTNGTLVDERRAADLKEIGTIATVCVSLDGPAPVHDAIRGREGCFEKATRAVRSLAPFIPVTVTAVIQNDNVHVLPEMVDLCVSLGARKIKYEMERLYGEERMGRARREAGLGERDTAIVRKGRTREYPLETLRAVLGECLRRGRERGVSVTFDPPFLMERLDYCYRDGLREDFRCFCHGFAMGTVAPNGDVIHCHVLRKVFGNIRERPLAEIWNSAEAARFRSRLMENNLTAACENCSFLAHAPRRNG